MEKIENSSNLVLKLSLENQMLILESLEHPKEPNLVMLEALKKYSLLLLKQVINSVFKLNYGKKYNPFSHHP
ncbi:antitoxin [Mannheimia haemolytica]|uniref:antitoxin n=1 Tax=Mannheimia haemolytica TaxID=75985 RepID=UPI001ADB2DFE|nr:antitoxin [Mannheimia haemolytica]